MTLNATLDGDRLVKLAEIKKILELHGCKTAQS